MQFDPYPRYLNLKNIWSILFLALEKSLVSTSTFL